MHILLRTSNSLQLWTASSGLTANAFVTVPVNETWFHVVGTFDGIMLTLYLDGQFIESVNAVGRYTPGLESQQKSFNIGNRGGGTEYTTNGYFYDSRYYARALSHAEVGEICENSNRFYGDEVIRLPLVPGVGDRSIISSIPDAPVVTMTHYPTSLTQPNAEKTSLAHLYHNTPNTAIISSQQKNIQTKKWAAYFAEGSTMRIPYDSYHMNHSHFSISFWLHLKSSGYETTDYHYIYSSRSIWRQ